MTANGHLRRFLPIPIALACAWVALGASSAGATIYSVGQVQPPTHLCNAVEGNLTFVQTGVSSGASYTIPTDGAIIQWSLQAGATPLASPKLKVVRPAAGGKFTVIGEKTAGSQSAATFSSFAAKIPVKENDRIGFIPGGSGECLFDTGNIADTGVFASGDVPLNTTPATVTPYSTYRIPISVLVLPPPIVGSLSPSSGAPAGKTEVTIKGDNLILINSVTFGGVPAESFKEVSETQATAVAPPGAAGKVDVRVTTLAGQSPLISGDQFTYVDPTTPTTPTGTPSGSSPSSTPPPTTTTGKRAAALKKCKGKKSKKAKKKCKKRAKKLPL